RARPGQDGQRRGECGDRLPLAIVEIGQELVGIAHGGTVPAGYDRNGGYRSPRDARKPRVAFAGPGGFGGCPPGKKKGEPRREEAPSSLYWRASSCSSGLSSFGL